MIVPLLYLILAGSYLFVLPIGTLFYLRLRWYTATSFERGFMYFLVFFFFKLLSFNIKSKFNSKNI